MIQQRLIEISRIMNSTLDLDTLLEKINICACELTNAETGSTMLYDPKRDALYFKVALGEKKNILSRITIHSEPPSIAWWTYANGLPAIVNDTSRDPRFGGAVDKATSYTTKSILCVPIILAANGVGQVRGPVSIPVSSETKTENRANTDEIIGVIEVINKRDPVFASSETDRTEQKPKADVPQFTVEDQRILSILAYQAAIAVRNAKAAGDRRNFFINAIEMFITAIESTGFTPPGHCMRVARSAMGMAHKLGIEPNDLHDLYYASALHDIGVLDIRCRQANYSTLDAGILDLESGVLSRRGCPRFHTVIGAEMVRPVNLLAKTEPIILYHHEAWNGNGYPHGIRGHEIPLGARIVAVAEAYEEIGHDREFIAVNAGKLFDPDVANAFLEMEL